MEGLAAALKVAASGLDSQSTRLRVVSENLANANSTSVLPGGQPYQRQTVVFEALLDGESGATQTRVASILGDTKPFPVEFNPGHQAADANGYVKMPNVNMLVEMADMREANRSYEANLQVFKQARELITMTIDLLRNN